ncbi:importin-13-like isoform X1 [Mytilus californianus]|uniref:importin-13-like isoform X1 n=1 Tax=Mytilus californianus TaxID=6549 RepID=UPI00224646D9|nr:importin-13-like isoform X1 [Mytilus californianus]
MAYTAENVEQAVLQFYQQSMVHPQIHEWLTKAQISTEAWSFSWELMGSHKTAEVQYFGANSLHVKISRFWHEVPPDQYDGLQSRLLDKIIEFGAGPKIVLTRLCVAISSLILHMTPEHWPDPLLTLVQSFQGDNIPNLNSTQRLHILLETIRVLPEEFFSSSLAQNRRSLLRQELTKGLQHVLTLLQSLMIPTSPEDAQDQALKCFSSWVEFGVPVMEGEPVILQVFHTLYNPNLFDTAVESLVNVFSHPDSLRFPYTIQKFLPNVLQLSEMFKKATESSDMDVCQGICQIVVALAENHTKLIIDASLCLDDERRNNVLNLIKMVLACTSIPGHYPIDENFSNMPFTFWYVLQDEILESDPSKCQLLLPVIQPFFFSLVEILLIKVQYPDDQTYTSWTSDEVEQFRCYRQDIGDTMMYSFSILREPLLGYLCSVLGSCVDKNESNTIQWQLAEAIFFLFGSVAESVDLEENLYMPNVMNLIPKLPYDNIKFISTALYMVGSFGEWLNYHPDILGSVIPLILQGLTNSEVATAATMSLKDVTRENLDHITPFIHQILSSSQNALNSNTLKSKDCIRLMCSIGQVLSVLQFEEIMQYLNAILTPHLQQMDELSKQDPSTVVKNAILLKLKMLSWLFQSLDTEREKEEDVEEGQQKQVKVKSDKPKPVYVVLQQIAPVVQALVTKWIMDPSVIEAVCELFKKSLRTLMDDFTTIAQDVSQMLVQMYQAITHPAILDLSKQLILMFGEDECYKETSNALFRSLCDKTLTLFQQGANQSFTDVIEGFMNFLAQVMKKSRHIILNSGCNITGIFHAGIQSLSLPEHHTVKASSSFLIELITFSPEIPTLNQVITSDGHVLVDKVLRSVGGESPRSIIENISDILFTLNKVYTEQLAKWLHDLLAKEGYPSPRVNNQDKEQFIKAVLREKGNKRRGREIVKEFTLKCRGLFGTEYAAQASAFL